MYKDHKEIKVTNIGSSMLLIIFLILCLLMFATLSLSAARSNALASRQNADRQTLHYGASNASQEILALLPELLKQPENDRVASTSAGDIQITTAVSGNGHTTLSWQIPFTDSQALAVTLDMADPDNCDSFTVTRWQTVSTTEWTGTQTIQVMTPEEASGTN